MCLAEEYLYTYKYMYGERAIPVRHKRKNKNHRRRGQFILNTQSFAQQCLLHTWHDDYERSLWTRSNELERILCVHKYVKAVKRKLVFNKSNKYIHSPFSIISLCVWVFFYVSMFGRSMPNSWLGRREESLPRCRR